MCILSFIPTHLRTLCIVRTLFYLYLELVSFRLKKDIWKKNMPAFLCMIVFPYLDFVSVGECQIKQITAEPYVRTEL